LLGAPLALAGAVGLALTHPAAADGRHTQGVHLLLAATALGSVLAALSKRMVLSYHPVCVTTLTTGLMCPCFLLGALLWGHPGQIASAPPVTDAILLGSGAYGLLIGGALYYFCLQKYGMVLTTFTNLAIPVFTGLFGYLIFREGLSGPEIASAGVLLGGCYLVVSARKSGAA
jgi:drug/metabolite transporter (DMT)-like permease